MYKSKRYLLLILVLFPFHSFATVTESYCKILEANLVISIPNNSSDLSIIKNCNKQVDQKNNNNINNNQQASTTNTSETEKNSACYEAHGSMSHYDSTKSKCVCENGYSLNASNKCVPEPEARDFQCKSMYGTLMEAGDKPETCKCRSGNYWDESLNGCFDNNIGCRKKYGDNYYYDNETSECLENKAPVTQIKNSIIQPEVEIKQQIKKAHLKSINNKIQEKTALELNTNEVEKEIMSIIDEVSKLPRKKKENFWIKLISNISYSSIIKTNTSFRFWYIFE